MRKYSRSLLALEKLRRDQEDAVPEAITNARRVDFWATDSYFADRQSLQRSAYDAMNEGAHSGSPIAVTANLRVPI